MTEITLIGLGAMGSALARALLAGGRVVTVWNRTAAKMEPLVALGAGTAASLLEAVEASPVIMVCIDNHDTTRSLLGTPDIGPRLHGKTLIQLSTGTPREARDAEAWVREYGADYLDGAIMVYPQSIGREDALILASGAKLVFERCRPLLICLGGDLRHVGENVGAAAALDLALLSEHFGKVMGTIHGARLCEAEHVEIDQFAMALPEGESRDIARIIHSGDFANPGATMSVWYEGLRRVQGQARDASISGEVPDFVASLFRRAIAAGHGGEDIAALVKALRDA
jgi:3-hydroxyisobutyrate dehydrogenase-like beta-hydroxyacid dehydrogenase